MMTCQFYQLCATGKTKVDGTPNKIYSIKVFPSQELANKHKAKFIKMVTRPLGNNDKDYLDKKDLLIEIGELILVYE